MAHGDGKSQTKTVDGAPQHLELVRSRVPEEAVAGENIDLTDSTVGRYIINRVLGEGGMGVVYDAIDVERNERVALKTLTGVNATSLWRFKREFRALSDLVHPNLVQLYELFSHENNLYLAMELVDGVEFHDYVWVDELPDHERLRDVLRQLAHGVQGLHDAGKLHLDIKPSNVMVTHSGRVVLLDFGLIEEMPTELTYAARRRPLSGTPSFMAPEQIDPKAPGRAADCYAIGVMLYQSLTGLLPFEADTLVDMLRAKREEDPAPPSTLVAGVPRDLEDLALRLLNRDPAQRATLADIQALVGGGSSVSKAAVEPGGTTTELVGRDTQMQALAEAFDRSRDGRPVTVYVEGESGIGKTALVRTFLRQAKHGQHAVVLEARCYQRDSLPLKTLDALVDSLTAYLRSLPNARVDALLPRHIEALMRLFPVLERVPVIAKFPRREEDAADPRGLRTRAFAALRELMVRIAQRRPLVLFIDDLQWGDVESGWLLEDLLTGPEAPGLLFIGGFRSGETAASPLLRELSGGADTTHGSKDVHHVSLGRLRPADGRALARGVLGQRGIEDDDLADAVAQEADGNPLFIEELSRYYAARREQGAATALDGARPNFDAVVLARVRALPEPSQRLLNVVAVAGRPLSAAQALEAAGHAGGGESLLRHLAAEHLVREMGSADGRLVETFHGRIRDAILAGLDPTAAEAVHAELARVLRSDGGEPERLTLHLLGAGRRREAGEAALLAAAHAEQALAFERAAALYSVALRNMTMSDDRRRDMETRRATALASAGKVSSATGLYLRTKGGTKREQVLGRRRLAAEKLLHTGHVEEGSAVLRAVMPALDLALPDSQRRTRYRWWKNRMWLRYRSRPLLEAKRTELDATELMRADACWTAATGLGLTNALQGGELGSRHLMLALRAGEPRRIAEGAAFYAAKLAAWGDDPEVLRWFALSEDIAHGLRNLRLEGFIAAMRGIARLEAGEWTECVKWLDHARDTLKRSYKEHGWETALIRCHRLAALAASGELADVARELPITIEAARQTEDLLTVTLAGTRTGHLPGLMADDLDRAHLLVDTAAGYLPRGCVLEPHVWMLRARVQIAQYAGDWDGAHKLLASHWSAFSRIWAGRHPGLRIALEFARANTALGLAERDVDRTVNLRIAKSAARALARSKRAFGRALGDLVSAELDAQEDRVDAALRGFESAAATLEECGMGVHAAAAQYRAGELSGEEGGRLPREAALRRVVDQGVRRPLAFLSMYAPGIDRGHAKA